MTDSVKPTALRIEASSACQLQCPKCPTAKGKIAKGPVGTGYLRARDFSSLLDKNPQIRNVELSNYGEIFLNPELHLILRHAHERQVEVEAGNGVNLNHARDQALEAVVRYQMSKLVVSIDGATQGTYEIYRAGGNLKNVINNIRKINEIKKKLNSPYPRLYLQFILFGHNEHEVEQVQKLARELDMTLFPKLNWSNIFSPVKNAEQVKTRTGLPVVSRKELKTRFNRSYTKMCWQLWLAPQINWDGRVLGCCVNYWGDFGGNVFTDGLEVALNNSVMTKARRVVTGKALPAPGSPCTHCPTYWRMLRQWDWIDPTDPAAGITDTNDYLPDGRLYQGCEE